MDRRTSKQQELKKTMMKYVVDGVFNITQYRTENSKEYNRLNYNFGSVEAAIESLESELGYSITIKSKAVGNTLINNLAFEQLRELRKSHTLQEIADYYGCTRQLVNQTWQTLSGIFEPQETDK